uniref:Uncharacterized protein n=1 Tax=Vespula pensylvanica TaxID=30213 RepID=A0A834NIH0_VESPE|nr:hypothetical protein H0235_013249 [Vespula pensylvanica]
MARAKERGKARELNGSADIGPSLHLAVGIVEPSTATATVERYRQDADSARGTIELASKSKRERGDVGTDRMHGDFRKVASGKTSLFPRGEFPRHMEMPSICRRSHYTKASVEAKVYKVLVNPAIGMLLESYSSFAVSLITGIRVRFDLYCRRGWIDDTHQ